MGAFDVVVACDTVVVTVLALVVLVPDAVPGLGELLQAAAARPMASAAAADTYVCCLMFSPIRSNEKV